MCRFACKDPTTCKIARFTVSPVKETSGGQFVRDKRVKFFSPPSEDSDSEDECFLPSGPAHLPSLPLPVKQQQQLPSSPLAPASASSSDSGFADAQINLNEEPDSGVSSQQSTAFSLKSILMGPKAKSLEMDDQQNDQKKRVRFADDHGHSLVQFRSIQSRRVDALFADLVDIGPVEDEAELSPWRAAMLLRKMSGFVAASSSFTASSSSTNDESVQR